MVRYLSALFTSASTPYPATSRAEASGDDGDFLKLDNDISIHREKIEIGTVLYDRRSSPTRASAWFTRLFSFIKEWRAARWVESFVGTRLKHLPGSQAFVGHIRQQGGVRRDELIDFLFEQRMTGISAEILGAGPGKSFGKYQIADLERAIMGRLDAVFGSRISTNEIRSFLDFIDRGGLVVQPSHRSAASAFVEHFSAFEKDEPQHPLVSIMQGKVRLLAHRLEEDRRYTETCAQFMAQIDSFPEKVLSVERSTPGWPDFLLAVAEGAKGNGAFHCSTKSLCPLEYAEKYLNRVAQGTDGTADLACQDKIWEATVERVFIRFNLYESRQSLLEHQPDVADSLTVRQRKAEDPVTMLDFDAFIRYCNKGPASISLHAVTALRALTADSISRWCEQTFRGDADLEDIKVWADNLLLQLQRDLDTFEGKA